MSEELSERQKELKERFIRDRGYWSEELWDAVLSIDGQASIQLSNGDRVDVRASQHTVRFLRFQKPGYFYRQILTFMDQNPSAGAAR